MLSSVAAIALYSFPRSIEPAPPNHEPAVVPSAKVASAPPAGSSTSIYIVIVLTSIPEPISVADPAKDGCLSLNEEPLVGEETAGLGASTSIVTVFLTFVPEAVAAVSSSSVVSVY